jgi:ubiquinone/menaquinone biosynthesis C-methylase UbiE
VKLLDDIVFPWVNDLALGPAVDSLRARVAGEARGRVLEIGAGTGLNFRHYPRDAEVTAVEPAEAMFARAARRAQAGEVRAPIALQRGRASALDFDGASFDAVVVTFVLCSVKNLDAALREVRRVLRPGGTLHLIEHVVSPDRNVARFQRRVRPVWGVLLGGCDPTRDIAATIERAGFDTEGLRSVELPLPFVIRAGILGSAVRP